MGDYRARPPERWGNDIRKHAGPKWMQVATNRMSWKALHEVYVRSPLLDGRYKDWDDDNDMTKEERTSLKVSSLHFEIIGAENNNGWLHLLTK